MHKALSFVKLDYITVKSYLNIKNLLIFLVAAIALSVSNAGSGVLIATIMAFALMYSSYPFAIGEKSEIDQFYATLPMSKHNIVLGRYGFVFALDAISGIAACLVQFMLQTILRQTFSLSETLLTTLMLFAVYTFFQALQLPIYFKLGYAKAKFVAYMPVAFFPLAMLAIGSLFSEANWVENATAWISNNQFFTVAVSVIIWIAVMLGSYSISLNFYQKREF